MATKHLGLDGECPASGGRNPVKARPLLPFGGAAQTVTAKPGAVIARASAQPAL